MWVSVVHLHLTHFPPGDTYNNISETDLFTLSLFHKTIIMITTTIFRDIPSKQFGRQHLAQGEEGGEDRDRGGDQDQAEAAAQPVLPEH